MRSAVWNAARRRLIGRSVARLALGVALACSGSSGLLPNPFPLPSAKNDVSEWEKHLAPNAPDTFRFAVAHDHGLGSWARFCSGFLFISHDEIRYEVLRPQENLDHAFRLPRQSIREAGKWRGLGPAAAAEFKFEGGKVYHFYLVHEATLDKDPHTLLTGDDVLPWPPVARLARHFDELMAQVKRHLAEREAGESPHPKEPAHPVKAEGPKVRVMEPEVADPNIPIEVAQPVLTLRGAAVDPHGVLSVAVNNRQAELRSTGDIRAMEFSVRDLKLQDGLNRVSVVAANVDHVDTQLTVLLWLRSKSGPSSEEPATVKSPAGGTGTLLAEKPLSETQILELLRSDIPSKRVALLVEQRGIDFVPANDFIEALHAVGAQDVLIEAVWKAKRAKASSGEQVPISH